MRLCIRPDCQFRVNITGYFIDRLNEFCFQCILESQSGATHLLKLQLKVDFLKLKIIFIKKVFSFEAMVFFSKIVLTYCEKHFEIRGWRPRICKIFEITRTIYSKSERSEQFLKQIACSCRFLISNILGQLDFKLEKIIGI